MTAPDRVAVLRQFEALRPAGGFGLIMADPPWLFSNYSARGEGKNPVAHYACASVEDICAFPVEALAARDCLLWLWAVNPMIPQALRVLAAWGFDFKTAGVWVKRTRTGRDGFGTGYVLRSASEPFLIGTRGAPKTTRSTRSIVASHDGTSADDWADPATLGTITIEAAIRAHSQKPEEAYRAAEQLMPDAARIEVFSRTDRAGWSVWGNEAGKFGTASTPSAADKSPPDWDQV